MIRALVPAVVAIAVLAGPAAAQDRGSPNAAADGFYQIYATFHPSDGVPDAAGRAKYAPYFSDGLNALLMRAGTAEAAFHGKFKDSPPLFEGDLFTSNFEGATRTDVAACSVSGATARCKVTLVFQSGRDKPVNWSDTLLLVRSGKGWVIDDIAYGAAWAFGNKGSLIASLKRVMEDAGG